MVGLVALLAAAACGGDGSGDASFSGPDPLSPSSPPGPASTSSVPGAAGLPPAPAQRVDPRKGGLEVGFGEWAVTPEADAIRPGPVTFVVHNGGRLVHGFELKSEEEGGSGSNSGSGSGEDEFKVESNTFGPGQTVRIAVDLPPGLYELECSVANHDELGMRSLLEVREDAPLVAPEVAASNQVVVEGFAFRPPTLDVPAQTEITWVNRDATPHTVTARDGSFDSDILDGGGTFSAGFDTPGEFAYFCKIHPDMEGVIRVAG
jgi:plastocyanin